MNAGVHALRFVMAFALLFEIFVRKSKGSDNPLVVSKADQTPRDTITWIPGDHFTLRVHLCDEPTEPGGPLVGAQIDAGDQIVLNGKEADALTGASFFSATPFTETQSDGEYYYEADLDLNVSAFLTAAATDPVQVLAEIQVQNAGNTKRLSYEFPVLGKARVYQGTEGADADGDPPYPLPGALALKTVAGKYRIKDDGSWQLWNADQSLFHTITVSGAAGAETFSIAAGEA